VDGLRALELGTQGRSRQRLTGLVLSGHKRATAGLLGEYEQEASSSSTSVSAWHCSTTTGAQWPSSRSRRCACAASPTCPWDFAAAEGEGDQDLEQWRAGHRRYWAAPGHACRRRHPRGLLRFALQVRTDPG
jgi:uncharacterized protein YhfF